MRQTERVDFESVADELYALAPPEFIAVRTARAKQARSDGQRQLAEQIQALRKPTTAAWIVNQLSRHHREEIHSLLDLGDELREVMADLGADEMRELTKQRYRLVSALVQQARALGHARGQRITEDAAQAVRTTLEATLSDPASAARVATGRLSEPLEVSGFGVSGVAAGLRRKTETPVSTEGAPVADLDAERLRRQVLAEAEREFEAAREAGLRASNALSSASTDLALVQRQREEADDLVERLQGELEQATDDVERLQKKDVSARREVDAAEHDVRKAEKAEQAARSRLDELE